MKMKKVIIVTLAALLVCGGGTYAYVKKDKLFGTKQAVVQQTTYTVKKGNVRTAISGTAQLEPQEQQTIVPPKEGMIKTLNLTRNQTVKKGDLLLEISDSSLDEKLDAAKLTLSGYQSDMQDLQAQSASLKAVAPASGKLILSTTISEGSGISKNTKIATISSQDNLTVALPFMQEEAAQIQIGDQVQLTLDGYLLTKSGAVTAISQAVKSDTKGNHLLDVTVRVDNDGTLDAGQIVKGSLTVGGLKIESKTQAVLQYKTSVNVMAGVSGTIDSMEFKENQFVNKGDLIATIASDTLQKDITNKQNQIDQSLKSIKDMEEQLEKLKVYAPFDGVFSTDFVDQKKNVLASYPVGTTILSNVQLGAVANLDTLQLPVKVDELDLPKIKVGQKAEVKVDAIAGKVFVGEVTQVSTVGTVTNGVSFYTAVVTLTNASELKYTMTATADILIEDKKDVIVVPVSNVKTRNGKKVVSLQKADGTIEAEHEVKIGANSSTLIEITEGLAAGDILVTQAAASTKKLTQAETDALRNQYQQGARNGGATGGGGGGQGGFPGGGGPPAGF
ncbi:HlyD family efflux transporter periplasmic adaptor subunit [Paenibacillus agricola]|uniref:HlyD family efflux transporter periplasmic adaptor subunit n=1 Tax=Paenibacillus agricola TaxID=2716264 RepID=A0ABX0J585_9BACL|nr:HlyD family efflux transporter periplasmic adaptor subunit [Paenibacillus agricola]NHN30595.1 HlyD family efflux transporter periplasmic adaptor subunit [Paenibacillus agricola]